MRRHRNLRPEWQPPQHFARTIDLLGEIGQTTALVFPARRLMVSLCGFLRGVGGGAQRVLVGQAVVRANPKDQNKGGGAAAAALHLIALARKWGKPRGGVGFKADSILIAESRGDATA